MGYDQMFLDAAMEPQPQLRPARFKLQESLCIRGLTSAMSAVIVSVAALRRQNCEIDEDIASVLERSAADRLDIEIEQLAAFSGIDRKLHQTSQSEGAQS